jgi:hypothetical protein
MMTLSVIMQRTRCRLPAPIMRTIIDLPESQLAALRELERHRKVSRAELIRQAVAQYVATNSAAGPDAAFGAWKRKGKKLQDGLVVQNKLRQEWDR